MNILEHLCELIVQLLPAELTPAWWGNCGIGLAAAVAVREYPVRRTQEEGKGEEMTEPHTCVRAFKTPSSEAAHPRQISVGFRELKIKNENAAGR